MAKQPVKVTITYCAECGYEPQTLGLAQDLMREFQTNISSIEIIPWFQGSFDVRVGEVFCIPPNMPHSVEAIEDIIDLDVFQPVRQDWVDGTDAYIRREQK